MKPFSFPLQRALDLRRREFDQAQERLLRVVQEQASVEQLAQQRRQQSNQALQDLAASPELRGLDLRMALNWMQRLEHERRDALAKARRLDQARSAALGEALQARRKVKLLEKLRLRKHAAHERKGAREQESLAAESYLTGIVRQRQG
jgi:hypothetical protein